MQVQDRARARRPRGRQRAPAEQRMDVVRVHDVGAVQAHGRRDVVRAEPAAQQPARGADATCLLAVALSRATAWPRAVSSASSSSTTRSSPPAAR